ncbi:hypothetical protein [Nocardioides coralli]|uniref:hypothetical protein n=1 Tax=Nocardioides coralli TaxID=2872154 RepID=UPI001CA39A98|nr:hypothetical protein [Nocardioides coralli]QZY28399.1 hypothetical protein K6T13_13100 [Nocardioides coralli]
MKRLAALLAPALVGSLLLAAAPAQADPDPVTVTWPERTAFNPDRFTYEVAVEDPTAAGDLVVWWVDQWENQHPVDVPAGGAVVTPDFTGGGTGPVLLTRCPVAASEVADCTEVSRSPELVVHARLLLGDRDVNGGWPITPDDPLALVAAPLDHPELASPRVEWRVMTGGNLQDTQLTSGTIPQGQLERDPATGYARIPFTLPPGVRSGQYWLRVRLTAETDSFGRLESFEEVESFQVDADAPTVTVDLGAPTFYPVTDGHLDELTIRTTTDEYITATLEVRDGAGNRVHHASDSGQPWVAPEFTWNGRSGGKPVPEGSYRVLVSTVDRAGNAGTPWKGSVRVSHDELRWKTATISGSAQEALAGKPYVGRCSTLDRKARGVLGFYSQTRCSGNARRSAVATHSGAYVPQAFKQRYDWAQVTLHGGPASRSGRDYVVLGLLDRSHDVVKRRVLRRGGGSTPRIPAGRLVVDAASENPYLLWYTGLSEGSRYDVARYTVRLRYQVLD